MVTYGRFSDGLRERNAFSSSGTSVVFANGASVRLRVTPRRVCVRRRRAVSSRGSFSRSGLEGFWGDLGMETEVALSSPETPGCHWAEDGTITPPSAHFWIKGPHRQRAPVPAGEVTDEPYSFTHSPTYMYFTFKCEFSLLVISVRVTQSLSGLHFIAELSVASLANFRRESLSIQVISGKPVLAPKRNLRDFLNTKLRC